MPTIKRRIANVIAERRLAVVGEPGQVVVIRVGKPRPEPDPSVWECSFLVEGIPNTRRCKAHGADSLQALQNAILGAKRVIERSGVVCQWGEETGDIGIPRTVPGFPNSGLSQKIEKYIDRELKSFVREAKKRHEAKRSGG